MEVFYFVIIVFFFIMMEGFFSGSEFGVVAYNKVRLDFLEKEGNKPALLITKFLKKSHSFLGTTLIGTNLCTVINTVIITSFLSTKFEEETAAVLAVIIFTPLTLLFGESLPKMLFQHYKETLTLRAAIPLNFFFRILSPVVTVLTYFSERILRILKVQKGGSKTFLKDDIKYLFFSEGFGGELDLAGTRILQRVFDFNKIEVSDIMVPLVKIEAVQKNNTVGNAIHLIKKTGYSRIPVYEKDVFNIIGVVYGLELLSAGSLSEKLESYIKMAYYIPKNMKVGKLLKELQRRKLQLAVVVDEYGGNIGIVTMEDLLEELVGDIIDEYDKDEMFLKKVTKNLYLVKAQTRISDLNKYFNINIPKRDFETISGFLLHLFEHIPLKGEKASYENVTFIIKEATSTKIEWILMKVEDNEQTQ